MTRPSGARVLGGSRAAAPPAPRVAAGRGRAVAAGASRSQLDRVVHGDARSEIAAPPARRAVGLAEHHGARDDGAMLRTCASTCGVARKGGRALSFPTRAVSSACARAARGAERERLVAWITAKPRCDDDAERAEASWQARARARATPAGAPPPAASPRRARRAERERGEPSASADAGAITLRLRVEPRLLQHLPSRAAERREGGVERGGKESRARAFREARFGVSERARGLSRARRAPREPARAARPRTSPRARAPAAAAPRSRPRTSATPPASRRLRRERGAEDKAGGGSASRATRVGARATCIRH